MPTYQYACTECGHNFETVQSFKDDSLTECPQCTGLLRKLFSSVGVVFKGSGFYRTDSRSSSSSTEAGSSSNSGSSSSGASSSESGGSDSSSGSSSNGSSSNGSSSSSQTTATAAS